MAVVPTVAPVPAEPADDPQPAAASLRGYLREALPPVYRDRATIEPPAIERWVGALEEVLDPIVLQLDNLAAHLDPRLAEVAWIDALTHWLGMRVDPVHPVEVRRARLLNAMALGQARGTLAGLQLGLTLEFPDLDVVATDSAQVTTGSDPAERRAAPAPELFLTVPAGLDERRRGAFLRLVESQLPAHVSWRGDEPAAASPTGRP